MFHITVKCVDCGALMVDVPSNTKRCAVCRVGHNRESVRRANETRRAEEAARPKPRSLDDDIVDKGDDSLSFEMTGNVAGSPYDTIVFLLRATSGLIAASAKDSADPQKVADVFAKLFAKRIAQDIQDERDRRAESAEAVVERFNFQVREISESVKAPLVNDAEQEQEEAQGAAHKPAKKGGCEE